MHHGKLSSEYCMTFKLFFKIFITIGILFSQSRIAEYEVHKRGELWDTMNDDGTHGAYPQPTGEFKPSMIGLGVQLYSMVLLNKDPICIKQVFG